MRTAQAEAARVKCKKNQLPELIFICSAGVQWLITRPTSDGMHDRGSTFEVQPITMHTLGLSFACVEIRLMVQRSPLTRHLWCQVGRVGNDIALHAFGCCTSSRMLYIMLFQCYRTDPW